MSQLKFVKLLPTPDGPDANRPPIDSAQPRMNIVPALSLTTP